MTDWSEGYVSEIGYTYGYYQELNPLRIKLAFLQAGLHAPEVVNACELGFGQGVSVNVHAAASVTHWTGTDFNPAQAGFAQELAAVSGSNGKFYDEAFAEFCSREDLPDFDYIGLHGIWSWISDDNRTVIVDFIKRKLKVGGVLYISYNTMPGWAAFVPLRDLLTEHAETMGATGRGIVPRIDGALEFAEQLLAVNPTYSRANPQVAERLKQIKEQNRNYLAHEYFNRDWLPMPFSKMAEWLAPTKLSFACSAHYHDHLDAINLSPEQLALINAIPDVMFRQTVRDFMVNQQFRRDYWVKGPRKLNALEQLEALRSLRFVLVLARDEVSLEVKGALGQANLTPTVYTPILDFLADHKIKTLAQIELFVKDKDINFAQVLQAMIVLSGTGSVVAVQDDRVIAQAKKSTDKLNAFLINKARGGNDIAYLASPVSGGGISLSRFQQLFLLALSQGKKQPSEWAQFVWQVLAGQGHKIVKEGKVLETLEENVIELNSQAQAFADKQLLILKALQII